MFRRPDPDPSEVIAARARQERAAEATRQRNAIERERQEAARLRRVEEDRQARAETARREQASQEFRDAVIRHRCLFPGDSWTHGPERDAWGVPRRRLGNLVGRLGRWLDG
jgi:hypothetical protein